MPVSRTKKTGARKKSPVKKARSVKTAAKPSAECLASKRVEVVYKGRVQGVGFRFCAEKAALECGAKGWVRNEPNGDVTLIAEAAENKLKVLLEEIRQSAVGRHIFKEKIIWCACRNEFDDFKIEYHF